VPFRFKPSSVARVGNELELRGRIMSGAFFGPENAILRSATGDECRTHIHSHGMEYPEAWPVLPQHRTVLILRIPLPRPGFDVSELVGQGTVGPASERVDVTRVLDEPEFWAIQASRHLAAEEVDDPGFEWFGVPSDVASEWYESTIDCHIRSGVWPYIRIDLPGDRYIELEMAGGVEYQDRVWIGTSSGASRVLLGYHSGHFSLPALRINEVMWLTSKTALGPANLLWLTTAYVGAEDSPPSIATEVASRVNGVRPGKAKVISNALLEQVARERCSMDEGSPTRVGQQLDLQSAEPG
jgi:hypothetical protein